jgi:hypothetical protein
MLRRCLICACASGCFVGFPPLQEPWLDSAAPLEAPECASISIEPDDATTDARSSSLGLVTEEPRTFCGEVEQGDMDYAVFHTKEEGRVQFELEWDGDARLELHAYNAQTAEWTGGDDDELELRLEPGFHTVLVAGADGRSTDYVLTAWLE